MDQQELRAKIGSITQGIEAATNIDAQSPTGKIFGALLLTGIAVVGELLLDVKRIADAAGPPVRSAGLSSFEAERVARFLAKKEAERRYDYDDGEAGRAAMQEAIESSWENFLPDAAELIAATSGAGK